MKLSMFSGLAFTISIFLFPDLGSALSRCSKLCVNGEYKTVCPDGVGATRDPIFASRQGRCPSAGPPAAEIRAYMPGESRSCWQAQVLNPQTGAYVLRTLCDAPRPKK